MNKIYIGNLPYDATEEELRDMFSSCGAIKEIAFIKDRYTQQCKGFSFIEFEDDIISFRGVLIFLSKSIT